MRNAKIDRLSPQHGEDGREATEGYCAVSTSISEIEGGLGAIRDAPPATDAPPAPLHRHGGYLREGVIEDAAFNLLVGLVILIATLPFFILIPILVYLDDGWPVLYRGERLGKDKKPFQMYKFRTLVTDAEKRLGSNLMSSKHRLETRFGRILRETRLDELPQLINVLKGDMRLVGPRPERRVVYESQCKQIPNYDRRFRVKPGIIGYSQLFTPHSAPKRVRALIDNYYVSRRQKWHSDAAFFSFAIFWLARRSLIKVGAAALQVAQRMREMGTAIDARASERVAPRKTWVCLAHLSQRRDGETGLAFEDLLWSDDVSVIDISDAGFAVSSPEPLSSTRVAFTLGIEGRFPPRRGIKRRRIQGTATLLRSLPLTPNAEASAGDGTKALGDGAEATAGVEPSGSGGFRHVLLFESLDTLDQLLLHQYFLRRSIF